MLDINILSDKCLGNIFSHSVGYPSFWGWLLHFPLCVILSGGSTGAAGMCADAQQPNAHHVLVGK